MTTGVAVMAKVPRPGHSKTRLIPALTAAQAASMSAAFLGDVTANLALAASLGGVIPFVAYSPAGADHLLEPLVARGTRMVLADGGEAAPPGVEGFGRCLLQAIQAVTAAGHEAACVLNADSPTLPTRLLLQTHDILTQRDCVVLGAAEDGGYYLLGMRRPCAALFSNIDWSTSRVAEQTRQRAAEAGLDVVELETWYDVDDPASLERLLGELSGQGRTDAFPALHTKACAISLGLLGHDREFALSQDPGRSEIHGVRSLEPSSGAPHCR